MDSRIEHWYKHNVYFGTSSWKYGGWKNLVYSRPYTSEKDFNENCLEEYAEHYPAVGIDHTFYTWPTQKALQKYIDQTPPHFRFGMKITERLSIWRYPNIRRYGKEAGKDNPDFLNPNLFIQEFLAPIEPFQERIGPLMLEFAHFYPGSIASGREFVERLDRFFTAVGNRGFQLAVEMRNGNWLKPPYFEMLAKHRVSHVFNSWTKMPTLAEQLHLASDISFPCYIARVLLRQGIKYEQAVEAYSPYDKLQDVQPELREGAAQLIRRAIQVGVPAYVFVNNRAEGCAPKTIDGILESLAKTAPFEG